MTTQCNPAPPPNPSLAPAFLIFQKQQLIFPGSLISGFNKREVQRKQKNLKKNKIKIFFFLTWDEREVFFFFFFLFSHYFSLYVYIYISFNTKNLLEDLKNPEIKYEKLEEGGRDRYIYIGLF